MKCVKCGAELRVGSIYCSKCGREAQIVSEDNLLEEELIRRLLEETDEPKKDGAKKKAPVGEKKPQKKKKKNHLPLIISLSFLVAAVALAATLVLVIRNKNENSYDYQVRQARSCVTERNYVKALDFYRQALNLENEDLTVRQEMVEVYLAMEEEKSAISMLHEIITMDASNEKAYQQLIALYEQEKDYEAVVELMENVKDESLLSLFADYMVLPPEFDLEPGTYPEYITVGVFAEEGCEIYYTTDGSDPVTEGSLYEEPFVMEEQGILKLRAVAVNRYGIYSQEIKGNYSVKFKKPRMAVATPDRGKFIEPTSIELSGPEGSRIYYTWDGTEPTVNSAQYTEPIPVPEGNNILSVLLVDKYGMVSDVLKCNYEYYP